MNISLSKTGLKTKNSSLTWISVTSFVTLEHSGIKTSGFSVRVKPLRQDFEINCFLLFQKQFSEFDITEEKFYLDLLLDILSRLSNFLRKCFTKSQFWDIVLRLNSSGLGFLQILKDKAQFSVSPKQNNLVNYYRTDYPEKMSDYLSLLT